MATFGEEIDFREEAKSIISDISFAVQRIDVSRTLNNSKDCAYMNIITLEGLTMCVQLNIHGLKVVGNEIDVNTENTGQKSYESIYSLLDSLSPAYVQKFGEKLAVKLANLQQ